MRSVKLNFEIKSNQVLFLWELLFVHHGEPIKLKDLNIQLRGKHQRDELEKNRLIETFREGRATFVVLSETGWLWCEQNLDYAITSKSPNMLIILKAQMVVMFQYMKAQKLGLYDFFMSASGQHKKEVKSESILTEKALFNSDRKYPDNVIPIKQSERLKMSDERVFHLIRDTYFQLTQGQEKCQVRLYDIKRHLRKINPRDIDRVILKAHRQSQSGLKMYTLDVPSSITDKDRESAIIIAGTPFHIIYVEK